MLRRNEVRKCIFFSVLLLSSLLQVEAFGPQSNVPNIQKSWSFVGAVSFDRPSTGASPIEKAPVLKIRPAKTILKPEKRFDRTASKEQKVETECILTIEGTRYNMTAWAKAHPGGVNVLKKFHGKDATKAFHAAAHSKMAYQMLSQFAIDEVVTPVETIQAVASRLPRWRRKLFTKEDPIGVHKYLGVFALLNFAFRYAQMYLGDPSAGLGTRMGKGPGVVSALCLVPHAMLSLSSLIFHTVPRERVVGKPMIWQEFRLHNIIFGLRSVICAGLAWLSYYTAHAPVVRRFAVVGSCVAVLVANWAADLGTEKLRSNSLESTTATMPYWEGCSIETQRRFKSFYAYCQFLATMACMSVSNPAWSFSVLIAIQLASLLMTLVRKGIISARGYHIGYTTTLLMPWIVGIRDTFIMKSPDFLALVGVGWLLYQLRRRGVNKYALWLPLCLARITVGDSMINWAIW